ncbi:MAG: amidohydrolase family protein [Planctomycetota bacterium]
MRIDAHHHFWRYNAEDYSWIDSSMHWLRRDFLPADLQDAIAEVGIDGVVSVQARQTLEETTWLLALAESSSSVCGVVGWVPLCDQDVKSTLERLQSSENLVGVRHVVQDEPDDEFLLREDFNAGVALLHEFDLAYDILVFERHLPTTLEFVDRHPQQRFVLDHMAKPRIAENDLEPWATNLNALARRQNVYCKVSGMVTEADRDRWTQEQLLPYWETVLDAFGPRRMMFGSDWPVCLLASEYQKWYQCVQDFAGQLSVSEQNMLFGGTATLAYNL